jgi:hypothetical protein
MTDTVRLSILRYVQALYQAATEVNPAPGGKRFYGLHFTVAEIGPLGDPDSRKQYVVGIVPGKEQKSDLFPLRTAMFPIRVEFRGTHNANDDKPGVFVENLLGVVQQVIYDDDTLGGLVLSALETENEIDMQTYADRTVQGVVTFMVHYRHTTQSVYTA